MEKERVLNIKNPVDIAHFVYNAAAVEFDELTEENEKRLKRFRKPLNAPKWSVEQMLKNIDNLTEMTFKEPRFQEYANMHPWNNESSEKAWAEIAKIRLRDDYLLKAARDDNDLMQQMYEIWKELIPDPALTKEERAELAKLQQQADSIIEQAIALEAEFYKLGEQEKEIVRHTQSKWKTLIVDQRTYFNVNKQYYQSYVQKWK